MVVTRRACYGYAVALGLLLVSISSSAVAQVALDNADGILNEMTRRFQMAMAGWSAAILTVANGLFWSLATLSLVWMGMQLILRKGDIGDFASELLRYVAFLGFFYWLLLNGTGIALSIVDGLRQLGGIASGSGTGTFDPAQFVQRGIDLFERSVIVLGEAGWSSFVAPLVGVLIAAVIMVILGLIAVNFVLVQFGAYVLIYAGIFFLGFGGARWTSDIAINYFKACLAQGMKLLTMACIITVMFSLFEEYYSLLGEGPVPLTVQGAFLLVTIMMALFVTRVPDMVAGIASGYVTGAGLSSFGVAAATSAAVVTLSGVGAALAGLKSGIEKMAQITRGLNDGRDPPGGSRGSIADSSGPGGLPGGGGGSPGGAGGGSLSPSGFAGLSVGQVMGGYGNATPVGTAARTPRAAEPTMSTANDAAGSGSTTPSTTHSRADSARSNDDSSLGRTSAPVAAADPSPPGNRPRARTALRDEGKGQVARGLESDPQAEMRDFVRGR